MKKILYSFIKYFIVFIVLMIIFNLFLYLSCTYDSKLLKNNVKSSYLVLSEQGLWYPLLKRFDIYNNNYTDALIINECYSVDYKEPFASYMKARKNYSREKTLEELSESTGEAISFEYDKENDQDVISYEYNSITELGNFLNDKIHTSMIYGRYWHGYLILYRPLLLFFNISTIRTILLNAFFILLVIFLNLLYKRFNKSIAFIFGASLVCSGYLTASYSLESAPVFLTMIISSIILVKRLDKIKDFSLYVFAVGCITNYFDYFTVPLVPFGVISSIYLLKLMEEKKDWKYYLVFLIKNSFIWLIGYAGTWIFKWILYDITIVDVNSMVNIGFTQIFYRIERTNDFSLYDNYISCIIDMISKSLLYTLISFGILLSFNKFKIKFMKSKKNIISFLVLSLYPIVWYLFTANHILIHYIFVYRHTLIFMLGILLFIYNLLFKSNEKENRRINYNKIKKYFSYLLPSLITLFMLIIIFYYNDLFPVGSKYLVQVDADYQYIPVFYRIYDFLHSGVSLAYSNIGLGLSIYGSMILQGALFSPLNLILLFISRNDIVPFNSILIIIKICLISFTSFYYINKKYSKIDYFYKVLFSVLYSFNGFILLNYFNVQWLDIVILFPLLVLSLDKLLAGGNIKCFIIILASCFILNIYFSLFLIIFILFYSSVNLYLNKKKDNKKTIFNLGKGSIIAFLISGFSSIPLLYQILTSGRFEIDKYSNFFNNFTMKSLYLLFSPLFIILFVKLILNYKNDKVNIRKYIILVILYIIPLIIDPINKIMHGGSYWSFPFRHGFILVFILMDASLYYLSNYKKNIKEKFNSIINTIYITILLFLCVYLNNKYRNDFIIDSILINLSNANYLVIICIVSIIFLLFSTIDYYKNTLVSRVIIIIISFLSVFIFSSWTIFYDSSYFLVENAIAIENNIDYQDDGRYKVDYVHYSPDYSYILNVPTLDNWVHVIPKGMRETYMHLGYECIDTKIYSRGGTIFSDWLLNFKYVFTFNDMSSDDMFTLIDSYDGKNLYQYNYQINNGVVIDNIKDIEVVEGKKFDYQNKIYQSIFNTSNNIINYQYYELDKDNIEFDYKTKDDSYLYIYFYNYFDIDYLTINDNNIYNLDDYIKFLGNYKDNVHIKIHLKENSEKALFDIGHINKKDIVSLNSNVVYQDNKYMVNVDDDNKYLFIPVNNINGISVYNNNQEVNSLKYLDNFILVKLNKGDNEISYNYSLPWFKISIIISIIGLILLVISNLIKDNKLLCNISYYGYAILIIVFYLYIYIYPIIKYFIKTN